MTVVLLGAVLGGTLGGFFIGRATAGEVLNDQFDEFVEIRGAARNGALTNPVLECRRGRGVAARKEDFRKDLERYVNKLKNESLANRVGVSFRDLNNGPSFGVDRDVAFIPASLLKVPVLIAYLKRAETEPDILKQKIRSGNSVVIESQAIFPPKNALALNTEYTVQELLERMVEYSDNDALALLATTNLPQKEMDDLYTLLGINGAELRADGGGMSVQEYSSFFRILYNASFLSKDASEYALSLLAKSDFQQGLRKGTPESVPIARKFGERTLENGVQHFHDCGIVYYPEHPYLLCIMTQGEDTAQQLEVIEDIASFVYTKIASQYPR